MKFAPEWVESGRDVYGAQWSRSRSRAMPRPRGDAPARRGRSPRASMNQARTFCEDSRANDKHHVLHPITMFIALKFNYRSGRNQSTFQLRFLRNQRTLGYKIEEVWACNNISTNCIFTCIDIFLA